MLKIGNREGKAPVQSNFGIPAENTPASDRSIYETATVIGEKISIEGVIQADEDIVIEGSLKGSVIVASHQLTVGKKGRVEADIQAENIVISGRMKGAVTAFNKVQISQGADFIGQIKAKSIAVEDGALLKASIELDKEIREKTLATPQHRIEAIMFPAEVHSEKIPMPGISKPNFKN